MVWMSKNEWNSHVINFEIYYFKFLFIYKSDLWNLATETMEEFVRIEKMLNLEKRQHLPHY